MVKVSVIVPVFNVRGFLRRCLDSLASQTLRECEVLFVDDGSTDGSGEMLDEFARTDARFQVIHQPNAGAGVARNTGLDRATGEYLFFFDPDDACSPDMLAGLYARAKKTNADVVVAGKTFVDAATDQCIEEKGFSRDLWRLPQPFSPKDVGMRLFTFAKSVPWDKLFRRAFILQHGLRFQDVRRCNDVYFTDMALALAERIALDAHAYYRYSVNRADSLQTRKDRAPFAVFEAYGALEAGLREKGVWPQFAEAYFAVYLLSIAFNLGHLAEAANVEACWRRLRDELRRLKESDGLDDGRLRTPWQRTVYRTVMDGDSPGAAVELMKRGKPLVRRGWFGRLKDAVAGMAPAAFREQMKRMTAGFTFRKLARTGFAVAFIVFVAGFGTLAARKCLRIPVAKLAARFPAKQKFVEVNGLATRLAGRRMCHGVVAMDGRMLVSGSSARPVSRQLAAVTQFDRWLKGRGIRYVYCQLPFKMDMGGELCPPIFSHTVYASVDEFLCGLASAGVETLDLRAEFAATSAAVMRNFYRTDHHWNNDAVFSAFKILSAHLGARVDESHWRRKVVPHALFGSLGRRTGRKFAGQLDDVALYCPDFETKMTLEIPERNLKVSGTFEQTIMRNASKIKTNGKSCARAYSYAYVGEIAGLTLHRNPSAPIKKKILIVGDSFVRPLEGLLSTQVSQIDVLDPRRYRGHGTVAEYVTHTSPDEVYQIMNPRALYSDYLVGDKSGSYAFFEYGTPSAGGGMP